MITQAQMFYAADRKCADGNMAFLDLVKDGMTREELARNIERRPALWGRFSNWLVILPGSAAYANRRGK